jgi:hypothetical protein
VASGAEWKPAIFRTIMSLWVSYRWTVVLQWWGPIAIKQRGGFKRFYSKQNVKKRQQL